jgi:receptor protein-tyrosine kinase
MSVEATDGEVVSLVSKLRDALSAMGRLTPEGALRIDEAMRTMGLEFGDAAIQLGLITHEEFAEALQAVRQVPPKAPEGILEGALHRTSFNRGLPVKYVGMVKPGPSLILVHDPDKAYSEQIRSLRTELLLLNSASRGGGNLIVILSPCQGEGRTQLCAELAIAFSQLGKRTLLVDADLRRPRVHALFESDNMVGLGQALTSGGAPLLLGVEKLPHLSVLIAGPSVPNPLELLTNGHFQRQLSDWRKKYSMIIIDTPPITEYADGLAIASFAEQVLIVGRTDSTPHKNMKEMLRRMGGIQSRIVGAVINSF